MRDYLFQIILALLGLVIGVVTPLFKPRILKYLTALISILLWSVAMFWIGYEIGRRERPELIPVSDFILQKIDFDYTDSPMEHGWSLIEGDISGIVFDPISDNFVGDAIMINSPIFYGMDYGIKSIIAKKVETMEFVANLEDESASIYAYVGLVRNSGKTSTGWLKFKPGEGNPVLTSLQTSEGEDEWLVNIMPVSPLGNQWSQYRINIEDATEESFGQDGWHYQQLLKLRVRGNISIDYISLLGRKP
jgi:hypothetical protein